MGKKYFGILFLALFYLGINSAFGQALISTHNNVFTTNFNNWRNTLPTGYATSGSGNSYVGTAASTSGGTYSIANAGFGYQASGSATTIILTGTFKNTTGSAITELQVSYQAFNIVARSSRTPGWTVTSSLGTVSDLNWIYNEANTPSSPSNETMTLTGLNIANNATFTFAFASNRGDGSGSSPLIGLNTISLKSVKANASITANPDVLAFANTETGSNSAAKTSTITGASLTSNIAVTAPANFQVSANGTTWSTTTSLGTSGGTLYVRFTPGAVGLLSGNITLTSGTASETISVSGTGITPCSTPATPNGSILPAENPACGATFLTYTGTIASGENYYWQTTASGTSTVNNATNTLQVSTTGTYYVRAYNGNCWSTSLASPAITIQTPVSISTQPSNQNILAGNTASFSVIASGTPTLVYLWQESQNGTDWNSVGTNSNTLSLTNVPILKNNYKYRVVISNSCGNIISNEASLTITEGPCVTEDISNLASASTYATRTWTGNDGTTWTAKGARSDQTLNGRAICFGTNSQGDRELISPTYSNGMGILTFNYARGFSNSNSRKLNVYVNDILKETITVSTATSTVANYSKVINVRGNVVLKIESTEDGQVVIDDISWTCYNPCTPTVLSVFPNSGPENTILTIKSNTVGNFIGLTPQKIKFNALQVSEILSNDGTILKVRVPVGAKTGNIIIDDIQNCDASIGFTVIGKINSGCETADSENFGDYRELMISEIYDAVSNNDGLIELYNPTLNPINLNGYLLKKYADSSSPINLNLIGTINPNETFLIGANPNLVCNKAPNIYTNNGWNANDKFELYKNNVLIDVVVASDNVGYSIRRKPTTLVAPKNAFDESEWEFLTTENCDNIGIPPAFPLNIPGNSPTITTLQDDAIGCSTPSKTYIANATEGISGGANLVFHWYYNEPGTSTWTILSENLNYVITDGTSTSHLTITNLEELEGYQYYCEVREDTATCFSSSNAVSIFLASTTWNGTAWSSGIPTSEKKVILASPYNTGISGNIDACSIDLGGKILTISENTYVSITNSISNNVAEGIKIENNGSLVQINDKSRNSGTGTISMKRKTQPVKRYDFTYWSSPVINQALLQISPLTLSDKFYSWNASSQAWDTHLNGNVTMNSGKGYIVRAPQNFQINTTAVHEATFKGKPNNGIIETPILGSNSQDQWNLIGNPYPSAIDADAFLSETSNATNIDGTIYLWTHNSAPESNPNSPNYQYTSNDYASYNFLGGTATRGAFGGNSNIPNGKIASGQGFFIKGLENGNAVFNNGMRLKSDNNQFYRMNAGEKNRIWLNLTNSQGAFNQTLIGYAQGATNEIDRGFDGVVFGGNYVTLYSLVSEKTLTIQGRSLPFDSDDIVDLGFITTLSGTFKIEIDHFDGLFGNQEIYLEDKNLNIIHDLKANPYEFNSEIGTFNERFKLRYKRETLGNPDSEAIKNSIIISKNGKEIKVKSGLEEIQKVTIYDILGKKIFEKVNINQKEFSASNIVQATQILVIKATLANGQEVTKKIIY
ncbi:T9SS sorting signal type C domain-containing protein [uncultured Flavobacterium sp.]|uniref:T9SS sorting signal type C domain-containing protein n=1 Tax=uncultured Flavobacterium sp. TaxID=165435 RepID=UPI0025FF1E33|nr:T9SS sorting signal type C domain-containing protein [uncultured Flavobacterium sp.]